MKNLMFFLMAMFFLTFTLKGQNIRINYIDGKYKTSEDNGISWQYHHTIKTKVIKINYSNGDYKISKDYGHTWNFVKKQTYVQKANFIIYPNPSYNYINFDLNSDKNRLTKISVYNSKLIRVEEIKISLKEGINNIHLKVQDFQIGHYYIIVDSPKIEIGEFILKK